MLKVINIGYDSFVDYQRNVEGLRKRDKLNDFCQGFNKNNTAKLKYILTNPVLKKI